MKLTIGIYTVLQRKKNLKEILTAVFDKNAYTFIILLRKSPPEQDFKIFCKKKGCKGDENAYNTPHTTTHC
ncbi:MAG: hypothetical protein Q4A81_08355, partial [Pasteurellaceae bacterium]|nr:hypothetical protein [Pasteurellaceae bacterium]